MPIIHGGGQQFHLQHSEEEKLNQFQTVTSFPDEDLPLIVKLLQNHSWNLEPALSRYFDGDWKENLLTPPVPTRGEIPSVSSTSQAIATEEGLPFLAAERNYIPALPVVSTLPQDYKEKFQRLGLQPSRSVFDANPLMFIVMLLPNMLVKLGADILSFLWHLLSFGVKGQVTDNGQKVVKFPSRPQNPNRSVKDAITAVLGDESTELLALRSELSFNKLMQESESKFKFMLIVFLGNLVGETTDLNSQRFLKHILAEKSTLEMLNEHKEDLTLYIGYTQDTDSWCVGKHLGTKYTPECYLVANVMNSTGSMNGTLQMSVLGNIRITSLKKFQRSLKMHIDRYTPELVVSRTEKEEIELARKLKEMQDQAFEESLRQDQLKEEKRRQKKAEEDQAKLKQERGAYLQKLQNTLYNLYWLDSALNIVDGEALQEDGAQLSVLQIRTSGGKRMVKKFPGSTTSKQIYLDIGSHLYLEELSTDKGRMVEQINNKIKSITTDTSLLCFKGSQSIDLSNLENTKSFVGEEFAKWNEVATAEGLNLCCFVDFELVSAFPRYKVPLDTSLQIKDISQIWPNGNLLVEYLDVDEPTETTV